MTKLRTKTNIRPVSFCRNSEILSISSKGGLSHVFHLSDSNKKQKIWPVIWAWWKFFQKIWIDLYAQGHKRIFTKIQCLIFTIAIIIIFFLLFVIIAPFCVPKCAGISQSCCQTCPSPQPCCQPDERPKPEKLQSPKNCKIEAIIAIERCSCKPGILNDTKTFIKDISKLLLNEHRSDPAELTLLGTGISDTQLYWFYLVL